MIDLCFGNAMKGCLLWAKSFREEAAVQTTDVVLFYEGEEAPSPEEQERAQRLFREQRERERRLWQDLYGPLDGGREDILCLHADLSLGDLSELPALDALKARAAAGEPIRIWDDQTPFTRCGLMYVMEVLGHLPCEWLVVSLPEQYTRRDGVVVQWRSWAELEPALLGHFAAGARLLPLSEREELARQWRGLQRENAPLRVLEDGIVRSAPADYYDDRIRRVFPEKICKAAEVVVRAMVEQKVPHGDEFIGQRLRAFIDRGELRIAEEDNENFLRSLIERNTV